MGRRAPQATQGEAAEMEKTDHVDWMEQAVKSVEWDSQVYGVKQDHKEDQE